MTDRLQGLSQAEVLRSREQHGTNLLTPPKRKSLWRLFFEKFNDPVIRILLVAALLSLGIGFIHREFAEAIGIFCAIFLATGVAFWFEYDAMKKFDVLNSSNDETPVKVVRDGEVMEIPKHEVVVGDTVVLQSGEEVPADGRLVEAVSLKVNESTLTGETQTDKTTDPARFDKEATYPSDRVMRGTTVIEGHGVMEVSAVGDATEFGHVARQATVESDEDTPLNLQLQKLSKLIGRVGISLAVVTFAALCIKGVFFEGLLSADWLTIASEILRYFMVAVTLIVVAVPEGLPMSVTLSLAVNMRRMLKTNNLVRKMHASETMGAITVICTDKTGTLTRNEMRVHEIRFYDPEGERLIGEGIAANSTAFLDGHGKPIGNPTEGALLLWLRDRGEDYAAMRHGVRIVDQLTFTTERKFMATLVDSAEGRVLYVKGAPEIVLAKCPGFEARAEAEKRLADYQNMAMRTLGFAYARTEAASCAEALAAEALRFIGIAAISDPVRDDVPEAVRECLDAGIAVKIVTGDTPATAREIGRRIGLWTPQDTELNHITGTEFAALSDEELLGRVQSLKIMSRARPLDKQRLVRLLQQRGEVVAVTGDGTNDAPALNFAQVGLSMGSGTSVAKEASDITLMDDSFGSIATAVMWGRSLYKNIQRFVLFQLTINFVAIVIVLLGSIFGSELPLTVTQMLWVNLIMDTFAALALASLPPSRSVMREKPRRNGDFILSRPMIRSIVGTGSLFVAVLLGMLVAFGSGITVYELSAFFTVFVMLQFWNMFNAKAFGTKRSALAGLGKCYAFLGVLALILVGQFAIVTWGGEVFRTIPLSAGDWGLVIGATSAVLWGGELVRLVGRKK
ncbi:calcium-translocating P-type ATPase, PMCA-type [uncultured Alistipes sp.]|uniref:calcium-translocating P-type ATPase, PMCA-type n=1 Tax=uncultured Alistipes sp. TaxID=538949 RepID=UPI002609171D|nr:calcium-translocating P-type ATPase, PMCA-type [uncultured Alistipes sp.]